MEACFFERVVSFVWYFAMPRSAIDHDILEHSIRLRITGARRMSVSRNEVIVELLKAGILADDIAACFKMEANDTWFVTFTDNLTVDQAMRLEVFRANSFYMTAERCDRRRVSMKIHWLPVWLKDEAIADFFSQFGKVENFVAETVNVEGVFIKTGIRKIDIVMKEGEQDGVPYRISVFGKQALVTIPGRPPLCLKCGGIGHVRAECPYRMTPRPYSAVTGGRSQKPTPEVTPEPATTQENQDTAVTPATPATPVVLTTETPSTPTPGDGHTAKRALEESEDGWKTMGGKRGKSAAVPTYADTQDSAVIQAGQTEVYMVTENSSVFEGDGPFDLDKV